MEYEYKEIEVPFISNGHPDAKEVARIVELQELDGWSLHHSAVSPNRHRERRDYDILTFRKPRD
jgi:hypothetical protein